MIDPSTYKASIYSPVVPAVTGNDAAQDAADAAEFARILAQPANTPAAPIAVNNVSAPVATAEQLQEQDGGFFKFIKGVIDVINPLQHIPVVSAIYRHLTGDEIEPMAQLAGDAIYGGPVGAAVSVATITYQKTTGKDVGETVIAALTGGDKDKKDMTAIAKNLNDTVVPSSGPVLANDIIWASPEPADVASNSSLPTPTSLLPTGASEEKGELALHPTTPAPVLASEDNANPTLQTVSKVDSTTVLHRQTVSGDTFRTDVSPELIAVRMMEGLDKYKAMNTLAVQAAQYDESMVNY